ncbi:hypothetical protein [Shewanella sp. YLB-07]|uniref:hypothetical protein n=1 Tax=Shewanella sp. YLB-07 TaxID=2601268 RepID=UPI00128C98DF|nr:hypothetical protein [Shewanella sp. YLB-07]MPY21138.1 hypothetical protein [Shewanella sp. YLB-07]MPY21925.1 hypothetical protein [Shewanella sp. YLB-07]
MKLTVSSVAKCVAIYTTMAASMVISASAIADEELNKLSKEAQDPLAKIISMPIFFNQYTDIADSGKDNNAILIQPVVPFSFGSDEWYGIARAIIPIDDFEIPDESGVGDTTLDIVFATNVRPGLRAGFGPIFQIPTHSNSALGKDSWGAGLSGGLVLTEGRWVIGGLATQVWDVNGDNAAEDINTFTFQPIVNYDFGEKGGWIFTSTPLIVADFTKDDDKWDVPIGGGFSHMSRIGKMPVSWGPQVYKHVKGAADWEFRFMVRAILPGF